jgi:hypothetical protein
MTLAETLDRRAEVIDRSAHVSFSCGFIGH